VAQIIALDSIYERSPAKHKKFREVIVFVHHYGGHKHSFGRHIAWVNELGFDAITFDLPQRSLSTLNEWPINKDWQLGLRHVWSDKIESVLGSLGENKFIFSFSFPSVAVLSALARRHAIDVRGWVAEGGPFAHIMMGIDNLLREENLDTVFEKKATNQIRSALEWSIKKIGLVRKVATEVTALAFGQLYYERDIEDDLKALPPHFPILSLRDAKDKLVYPTMIDDFFAPAEGRIDLHKHLLPEAGHLQGFSQHGDIYRQVVSAFLIERATRI
jgi:hypothetical protein